MILNKNNLWHKHGQKKLNPATKTPQQQVDMS